VADRSKVLLWALVIGAVVIFGCLGSCLGTAFFCGKTSLDAKTSIEGTATQFFGLVHERKFADARALTTKEFQAGMDPAAFEAMAVGTHLVDAEGITVNLVGLSLNYGTVPSVAKLRFSNEFAPGNSPRTSGDVELREDNGVWLVHSITGSSSDTAGENAAIPDAGRD
jgi:hypothetical protein